MSWMTFVILKVDGGQGNKKDGVEQPQSEIHEIWRTGERIKE